MEWMNVLIVGSSLIDLFLVFKSDDHLSIEDHKLTLELGDKIPVDIKGLSLGGNGANVSVGLSRLGFTTTFYTYLGRDILSRQIQQTLCKEGITLIIERGANESSSLSLIFNFSTDRIIFSHHQVRDHKFDLSNSDIEVYTQGATSDEEKVIRGNADKVMPKPDFIYLTSIGKYWEDAYKQVFSYTNKNTIPYIFAPGSHQIQSLNPVFYEVLRGAYGIFVNKREAEKILQEKNKNTHDFPSLLLGLASLGPKLVSITDGRQGSYFLDEKMTMYKIDHFDGEATEKTGAGDAYAAGFLGAYFSKHDAQEAMRWGSFNAHAVMQQVGAESGLLTQEKVLQLSRKHKDYLATILT